jgi:HlyD family secretion protein
VTSKTLLASASVALVAASVGGMILLRPTPLPPSAAPTAVAALGRLLPEGAVVAVGGPPGARLGRFEEGIEEGVRVTEGTVVAYLDTYPEALAVRDHAVTELAEAEERRRAEEQSGQARVDEATVAIERAERALRLKYEAQEAEVRRATAELDTRRLDEQRANRLRSADAILPAQHEAATLAVRQAQEVVNRSQAALSELREELDLQLRTARAGLRAAEGDRTRALVAARVQTLRQALRVAEARLDLARIRAPITGEILGIVAHPGEAIGGLPILKIGNTASMVAIAEVYETDVRLVRVGQRATVSSRALGEAIPGRVERIGTLIHKADVLGIDPVADTDGRVIEVRIRLEHSSTAARFSQHQVDVLIDTATAVGPTSTAPPAPRGQ